MMDAENILPHDFERIIDFVSFMFCHSIAIFVYDKLMKFHCMISSKQITNSA